MHGLYRKYKYRVPAQIWKNPKSTNNLSGPGSHMQNINPIHVNICGHTNR